MHPEIQNSAQEIDTADWKEIAVEYGREILMISVPPHCDTLTMKEIPILPGPWPATGRAASSPRSPSSGTGPTRSPYSQQRRGKPRERGH
jgi:hypothetical protein